jgi:endo-1,4-beta-xylanase
LLLCACAVFGTCKFDYDSRTDGFVPVEDIKGVPTGGVKGYEFTLSRSVEPETATNKTIVWSITEDGRTNAALNRNKLTATESGTVRVEARIKDGSAPGADFTAYFDITILDEYNAVNAIQDIPLKILPGTYKLEGTVKPDNAVNKTIIWELKEEGTTGALLVGDTLTTSAWGKLTVTAIVEKGAGPDTDFSQDFEIRVAPLPVTSITGVATGCVVGDYTLPGIVSPRNATFKNIIWEVKSAGVTGAVINGNVLTTTSVRPYFLTGTVKVTAVVKDGIDFGYDFIQDFVIGIVRSDVYVPVSSMTGFPTGCPTGDFILSGNISPYNATNKTIIWELVSADETGAVIDGNMLTTLRAGSIDILARIKDGKAPGEDFTEPFTMNITE